jgi:hypothetical protein
MDLTLKINAEFDKATKAFNELASSSEETRAKIEKFSESFQTKSVDSFIDRQKLLQSSLTGTRGETAAMQKASNEYGKEIERLIKSGLSPESEAIQRLRDEQTKLKEKIKEANDIQKAQTDLMKLAEKAALACYAAIGAGIAAIAAMTQKTAEMGDQFAKSSRLVGMTAEQFQELNHAAKMSGVKDINGHLLKLNKTLIDVKNGTGNLTKYLKENNAQLLTQVKSAKSNEQAFMLMIDAIKKAPDELSKAELATAAFGKSGQEMILMAENGAEGIAALREEARKYGVISNEAAANSEKYLDAQARLKAALTGVGTELTSKLLPGMTQSINKIADFIASVDDWEKILKIVGYTLAGVTAGLTAFLVITKGAQAIQTMATAFKALNAAIAANPIGAMAVVITAVLIPALIYLFKNWDMVQTYIQQGIGRLEYAFKWFASQIKEKFILAVNSVKIGFLSLAEIIVTNVLGAVAKLLDVLGKIPGVGEQFKRASDAVKGFSNGFREATQEAKNASDAAIQAAKDEQDATEQALKDKLTNIDIAAKARRDELEARKKQGNEQMRLDAELGNAEIAEVQTVQEEKTKIVAEAVEERKEAEIKSLKDRLNEIALTEKQAQNQQVEMVKQFLQQRAVLETDNFEERIAFLEEQKQILLDLYTEGTNERVAIEMAADEAIKNAQKDLADYEQKLLTERLSAFSGFFNGLGKLMEVAGEKNRGAAILMKALASAESAINSYLAFTNALSSMPYPYNIVAAAGVLATGLAAQIKIMSTPIPSAETGGRFIVPNSATGVDGGLLRVNKGEEVSVTPRGQVGNDGESFNFNFVMDGHVFAEITNKLARAGELHTLQLAGNL